MGLQSMFDIMYLLAFLSYILLAIFIVYHLVRYSLDRSVTVFTVALFVFGTIVLLSVNAYHYSQISSDESNTKQTTTPSTQNNAPSTTKSPFQQ